MRYTVVLDWDAEGNAYVVSVPALPGCFAQGPTVDVATERAKEAIKGCVGLVAGAVGGAGVRLAVAGWVLVVTCGVGGRVGVGTLCGFEGAAASFCSFLA